MSNLVVTSTIRHNGSTTNLTSHKTSNTGIFRRRIILKTTVQNETQNQNLILSFFD